MLGCGSAAIDSRISPDCEAPASFLSCDRNESDGAIRCWSEDRTDWLLYADGTVVHELRIAYGCCRPIEVHELCRGMM